MSKLEAERVELEALRDDLPRFVSLVGDNQRIADDLKRQGAPLDKQVEARARVNASRELLKQHQADVATAEAEVLGSWPSVRPP